MTDCNLTHKNAKDSDDILFPYNQFSNNFLEMAYLFTSESVSEGHPDKIADQISDALIDNFIAFDTEAKVACETLVTTGQVILAGEVKSKVYLEVGLVISKCLSSKVIILNGASIPMSSNPTVSVRFTT